MTFLLLLGLLMPAVTHTQEKTLEDIAAEMQSITRELNILDALYWLTQNTAEAALCENLHISSLLSVSAEMQLTQIKALLYQELEQRACNNKLAETEKLIFSLIQKPAASFDLLKLDANARDYITSQINAMPTEFMLRILLSNISLKNDMNIQERMSSLTKDDLGICSFLYDKLYDAIKALPTQILNAEQWAVYTLLYTPTMFDTIVREMAEYAMVCQQGTSSEFSIPVHNGFNILANTTRFTQRQYRAQDEAILNLLTPDETINLLTLCTINCYNCKYQEIFAPKLQLQRNFKNSVHTVEYFELITKNNTFIALEPQTNQHDAALLEELFNRKFELLQYTLLYESLLKSGTPDELLILKTLYTPAQLEEQTSLKLQDSSDFIMLPDHYVPAHIRKTLIDLVASLTSTQKLFLAYDQNLVRTSSTLYDIATNHADALNNLKKQPNALFTHTSNGDSLFTLCFESLYNRAQALAESVGTPAQKALAKLQACPEDQPK